MRVLTVGCGSAIQDLLRILGHTRWRVIQAGTVNEAVATLPELGSAVVVSEAALEDGCWVDVLRHSLSGPSRLPVIVTAKHADDHLWVDVLNSGGYNVLGMPFEEQEVFRVISMAWLRLKSDSAGPKPLSRTA